MPMPERFYTDFDNSFLGSSFAKTLPVMYESTAGLLHPNNPDFMNKVEHTLLQQPTGDMSTEDQQDLSLSREQVYRVMFQIDKHFSTKE